MDSIKVTGLWKHTSKDGVDYLAANLGSLKVMVWPHTKKDGSSNEPDFRLLICKRDTDGKKAQTGTES